VLPNRNTFGLLAVLFAMWYAGASQSNAAAYLLCFVLASVAAVSTVHTWSNVRGVRITSDMIRPVFEGDELAVSFTAFASGRRKHYAISASSDARGKAAHFEELAPGAPVAGDVRQRTKRRGFYERLPLRIASRYPLGFFTAVAKIELPQSHFVYPRPQGDAPLRRSPMAAAAHREGTRAEGDDFGGVRAWQPGESQRHIDWKAAARGQPLLIKQWAGDTDEVASLDWESLPALDDEARLRQLTRWVLAAESLGLSYSLHLPQAAFSASRGEAHYHQCLRALAVCPKRPPGSQPAARNGALTPSA
jgi:uncharacterized protein (DUF58 family)